MIGTGKYDFPGIRKAGAAALKAVILSTGWGATIIASPFAPLLNQILEYLSEYLANKGLLIINLGAIYVDGEFDQSHFDHAMSEAIEKAKVPGLSEQKKKEIDDAVIKAFRNFARVGNKP